MNKFKKYFCAVFNTFKKLNLAFFFSSLFFTVSLLISGLFTPLSQQYFFGNKLYNYRRGNTSDNTPSVRIHKENEFSYESLYSYYYYNTEVKSFRTICDEKLDINHCGFNYDCVLTKIQTYSITEKYSWGYYIDGGLFSAYYKNELLPDRKYLSTRFDCDGFAFISDSLADKLLASMNLTSYEDLILNEDNAVLKINNGRSEKTIRLCINNIVYSKYRTGPRISEIYGDFILLYLSASQPNKDYFNWSVELDLKSDVYENKKLLKNLNSLGYNPENSSLSFYVFDKTNKTKNYLSSLDEMAKKVSLSDGLDKAYLAFLIVFAIAVTFLYIYLEKKYGNKVDLFFFLIGSSMILYFIITFFIFLPPLLNIGPSLLFLYSMVHFLLKIPYIRFNKQEKALAGINYYVCNI